MIEHIEIYANDYIMKLVNKLEKARKVRRLTKEKVAQMAGISYSTYLDIESGKTIPKVTTALLIAKALTLSVEKLFNLDIWGNDSEKGYKGISDISRNGEEKF